MSAVGPAATAQPRIQHRIHASLLARSLEYTARDIDRTTSKTIEASLGRLFDRHRDAPAVFRDTRSIPGFWSPAQLACLARLFADGWEHTEPMRSLKGFVRKAAPQQHSVKLGSGRPVSVKAAVNKPSTSTPFVLEDIELRDLGEAAAPLLQHPPWLARQNLLAVTEPLPDVEVDDVTHRSHYHALLQMLIGRQGSHTPHHVDFYGVDSYLQLMSGAKVWWLAPPESHEAFAAVFAPADRTSNVKVTGFTADETASMLKHRFHAIVQEAGDCVLVPAGWSHCVKNLTDTVAFGGSFVRPWKLRWLLLYAVNNTQATADSLVHWRGVIEAFAKVNAGEWGVTPQEQADVLALYRSLEKRSLFFVNPAGGWYPSVAALDAPKQLARDKKNANKRERD